MADYSKLIWQWLKTHTEITEVGIAAIMGNIACESSYVPNIVQRGMGVKLTDAEYTAAADAGSIPFYSDKVGYGLCQWTYGARKKALLEYCKTTGRSVGNYEAQLEFMLTENEWKNIERLMTYATDMREAAALFCAKFEIPAVQNVDARYKAAVTAYNNYHGTTVSKLDTNIEDKYQWIRDEIVFLKEDRARLDERIKYYESRLPEGELNE